MGRANKKRKHDQDRRMKIQGWIGTRDGQIATLCIAVKPTRQYMAIERFKKGSDAQGKPIHHYIETPFDPRQTKGLDRLKAWLEAERRYQGSPSTAERYHAGLKNTGNTRRKSERSTSRDLHEYSSEISGPIQQNRDADTSRMAAIANRAADLDRLFFNSLKQKPVHRGG
jgi:hypothetical protein